MSDEVSLLIALFALFTAFLSVGISWYIQILTSRLHREAEERIKLLRDRAEKDNKEFARRCCGKYLTPEGVQKALDETKVKYDLFLQSISKSKEIK